MKANSKTLRQESASYIPIGKSNSCLQHLLGKLDFVLCLLRRAQAFQNLICLFDGWRSSFTV